MPELPEVETVVRGLRPDLEGRAITGVWWDWERVIAHSAPQAFAERVRGQRVQAVGRRAKYILLQLTHDVCAVHLRMTGRLYVAEVGSRAHADRWVHLALGLDDGRELRFSDARKFGRVWLLDNPNALEAMLGVEPLEPNFTPDYLVQQLAKTTRPIKAVLLDQSVIAGVGNIYADEALFRAGVRPTRPASTLTTDETTRLHAAIRAALQDGIAHEGASINWYRKPDGDKGDAQTHFAVYGRDGQPCKVCGTLLLKTRVAQRGTHYCPQCQS